MEYEYSSIEDIYNRLKDIVANPKNEPLDLLGSYIVGCTFVLDDIDKYYADYPVLEEIAEHGAELETIDDISYQNKLMNDIKSEIMTLGGILTINMKNQKFLENFYSNVILSRYSKYLNVTEIHWIDHGRLDDPYVCAHYFETNEKQYVLLSNDYAEGSHLDDGLSYELVRCGDERSIELNFRDNKEIENITGRYTLYREKVR